MTTLHRVVVEWSGTAVNGRACNVLYYDGSDNAAPPTGNLYTAYAQIGELLPAGLKIQVPSTGDSIDDRTGNLSGSWSTAAVSQNGGGAAGNVAAGAGACVTWTTGGIVQGTKGPRRLRGRTFLVPLAASAYDTDGTLNPTALTKLQAFGTSMMQSGPLAIWHRPVGAGATNGNSYGVQSFRVRDKVAVLRSRRD